MGSVTREEALKIILNGAQNVAQSSLSSAYTTEAKDANSIVGYYNDVQENIWSAQYISFAHMAGVVNGKADRKFYPHDSITRGELAKIVVLVGDIGM